MAISNFEFHNPVQILFGKGEIAKLPTLISKSAKIMLTYGGGSIKKNGVYDQVIKALAGYSIIEFGGIEPNPKVETLRKAIELGKKEKVDLRTVNFIWDIIKEHGIELINDLNYLGKGKYSPKSFDGVYFINKENIYIGENTVIKPGVVLDASNGPIFIGENTTIFPNSVILGPVYIGNNTLIKSLAKIYENVSIGDVCKVGGEIEDTIIMSYSNKQHDGFIGHAYLGNWINLGADTNCSDLRNNYGFVKTYVRGELINTKTQFLGLIMGDHSKSGINTMFNTGTVVGVSCNIYGSGFPSKNLPSFTWGGKDDLLTYEIEKCLDTANINGRIWSTRRSRFIVEI